MNMSLTNLRAIGFSLLGGCLTLLLVGCTSNSGAAKKIYGQIEAKEVDVASRVPSRIRSILVEPGQKVEAGDTLVEFEDDIIAAKKNQVEAKVRAAESQEKIAQDAVRPEEMRQLEAGLRVSQRQMSFAEKTYKRMVKLFKEGAISQQQLDEIKFKYEASQEKYNADKARLDMAKVGARAEQKEAAQALVDQAQSGLAEVKAYESDMKLKAPITGEVLQILNSEGELVPQGYPVVTLLRSDQPWATFHLRETALKDLVLGQPVTVEVPALGRNFSAKVTFISPAGSFANFTFTQDKGAFDVKTFEVRATLERADEHLRPGMTAVLQR